MASLTKRIENALASLSPQQIGIGSTLLAEALVEIKQLQAALPASYECEFCGDPATKVEQFDRSVHVCDACSAENAT